MHGTARQQLMTPTSHGPEVWSTRRYLMAAAHQSSCLGLHVFEMPILATSLGPRYAIAIRALAAAHRRQRCKAT
jgi:hypothetical protein